MSCPLGSCNDSNCPKLPLCLAERRGAIARNVRINRAVERQITADNSQEIQGTYRGHDATTGQDLYEAPDGGIIKATPISNSYAQIGQQASSVAPLGSANPIADRMPR